MRSCWHPCRFGSFLMVGVWMAVTVLAGCAPAENVEELFAELEDPDFEVRQDAAGRIQRLLNTGDHTAFVRVLESPNLYYRAQSMLYLAQIPGPDARAALRDLLRRERRMMLPYNPIALKPTNEKHDSRILAARLIHRTGGDPEAIDLLLEVDPQSEDPEILQSTCYAIGALLDARGIPFLDAASSRPELDVARAAVQALGMFPEAATLEVLERLAGHASVQVRSDVLAASARLEDQGGWKIIRSIGASDPSPDLRSSAVSMLGRANDLTLVPYMIDRLEDEVEAVRMAAAAGLRQLTGETLGLQPQAWRKWWEENETTPGSQP